MYKFGPDPKIKHWVQIVKVSVKIVPISFWAGPITENVNQM